jgi:uncharacterized protein with HEPN domain
MQHDVKKYLQDIVASVDGIKSYTNGITKFADFVSNRLVYRAVERELEIIAEAITRIKKVDASIEISNSKKIIGLRNRVIHSYDTISEDIVWGVIVNHLDGLKTEVDELIKKFE